MTIYGVGVLAFCFLAGKIVGESIGRWMGIDANVGGVGFAMILLILLSQWLRRFKPFESQAESGILFWTNLYIPVIVAMSAVQNVKGAIAGGGVALLAGTIPVAICMLVVRWMSKRSAQPIS